MSKRLLGFPGLAFTGTSAYACERSKKVAVVLAALVVAAVPVVLAAHHMPTSAKIFIRRFQKAFRSLGLGLALCKPALEFCTLHANFHAATEVGAPWW